MGQSSQTINCRALLGFLLFRRLFPSFLPEGFISFLLLHSRASDTHQNKALSVGFQNNVLCFAKCGCGDQYELSRCILIKDQIKENNLRFETRNIYHTTLQETLKVFQNTKIHMHDHKSIYFSPGLENKDSKYTFR